MDELITEDWLRSVGFKWEQLERQPGKNWLLWLGGALGESWTGPEDLGIEVASGAYNEKTGQHDRWFCWIRSDSSHRYHRFIHIRHLQFKSELIKMIEGLTGQTWNPQNHWYGSLRTPTHAENLRREHDRLDKRIARSVAWSESEKDESRSGPLRGHLDAAVKSGLAK